MTCILHASCVRKHSVDHVSVVLTSFQTVYTRKSEGDRWSRSQRGVKYVVSFVYCRQELKDSLLPSLTAFTDEFFFECSLLSLFGLMTGSWLVG